MHLSLLDQSDWLDWNEPPTRRERVFRALLEKKEKERVKVSDDSKKKNQKIKNIEKPWENSETTVF